MAVELFTRAELEAYLQRRHDADPDSEGIEDDPSTGIDPDTFQVVHRLVKAWLADAMRRDEVPSDSDLVWSWGIELAALAVDNPTSTTSMTTDRVVKAWSAADARRRDQILARAREWEREQLNEPVLASPQADFPCSDRLPADVLPMRPQRRWVRW